jgi:hypothetical protein
MIFDASTVYTVYGYRPDTRPAIKWQPIANGNYRGSDRGAGEDVFEARVVFEGPRTELEILETFLAANRTNFEATFGEGEEIFGADIDYSSQIQVTIVDYGEISQLGFDKWGMALRLRAYKPTFLTVSESLEDLRLSSHRSEQNSEFDITKIFSYDEKGFFSDHASDPGIFEGDFTQTTDEMKRIRRYLLNTLRNGSASPFPTFGGITTPFGFREGTGPFTFRVIEWRDMGRPNFIDWKLRIKFAREFI